LAAGVPKLAFFSVENALILDGGSFQIRVASAEPTSLGPECRAVTFQPKGSQ
jgi:hypothetical protein